MTKNWEELLALIKAGKAAGAYLFYGPEALIKESALQALRQKLLPAGLEQMNESVLEGASAQQIIEAAETMPLMAEKRLVVVKDWAPLLPGKSRDEENEVSRLEAWLKTPIDTCVTVFVMRDAMDGRKKAATVLQKLGTGVNFQYLDDQKLGKWLTDRARARGVTITRGAAQKLPFMAGNALTVLSGEMEKLAAYAGAGGTIDEDAVEKLVAPRAEFTVFQMIDCLMAGDAKKAFDLLYSLMEAGESRIGVIAMLTRQMRMLSHIRLMTSAGASLPEMEKRLELSHFVASRAARQAAAFEEAAVTDGYRACVEAEYSVKSGGARDEAALDYLMMTLSAMKRSGRGMRF